MRIKSNLRLVFLLFTFVSVKLNQCHWVPKIDSLTNLQLPTFDFTLLLLFADFAYRHLSPKVSCQCQSTFLRFTFPLFSIDNTRNCHRWLSSTKASGFACWAWLRWYRWIKSDECGESQWEQRRVLRWSDWEIDWNHPRWLHDFNRRCETTKITEKWKDDGRDDDGKAPQCNWQ